jgi:hypothetical protein
MRNYQTTSIFLLCILIPLFIKAQDTTMIADTNPVYLNIGNNPANTDEADILITWITPEDDQSKTSKKSIRLKIGINSGSTLTDVKILINDQPVSTRGFKVVESSGYDEFDKLIDEEIELRGGINTIQVVVRNEDGSEKIEKRTITGPKENDVTINRTDYALLFATDEYDSWDNLVNPVNDAKTIADELEKNFGFKVELIANPTQEEILLKLRDYSKKSYLPYDQLFIFFAGHGQYDQSFGEGYIVAKNSSRIDLAKTSYISHSVLRNIIDNIPSEHIFLIMDVCFGGTFDPLIAQSGQRGSNDIYEEISMNEYIMRKLDFKTRQYITSGGKEYVPDGNPGMHSPFARKFIEALRDGGGSDHVIKISEIKDYLERTRPEPRAGEFGRNEPGSDFLFIRQTR